MSAPGSEDLFLAGAIREERTANRMVISAIALLREGSDTSRAVKLHQHHLARVQKLVDLRMALRAAEVKRRMDRGRGRGRRVGHTSYRAARSSR